MLRHPLNPRLDALTGARGLQADTARGVQAIRRNGKPRRVSMALRMAHLPARYGMAQVTA